MRNRFLFLFISLTLLLAGVVSLAAQEENPPAEPVPAEEPAPGEDTPPLEPAPDDSDRITLPDAPLKDLPEKEPAPEEQPVEVKAEETNMQIFLKPGSFFLGFGIGGILPLANFESSMTFGYELFINASYRVTSTISIAALAGMTGISSAVGGTPLNFYNFGIGGRGYLPLNETFFGWAELGLNGHTTDFTDFTFGYHAAMCAGWLWAADSALELGVEYNASYTLTQQYVKIFLTALFKL